MQSGATGMLRWIGLRKSLRYSSTEYNYITIWFGVAADVLVPECHSVKQLLWFHLPNLWCLSTSRGSHYLLTEQTPLLLRSITLPFLHSRDYCSCGVRDLLFWEREKLHLDTDVSAVIRWLSTIWKSKCVHGQVSWLVIFHKVFDLP